MESTPARKGRGGLLCACSFSRGRCVTCIALMCGEGIGARKNRQVNLYPHSSVEDLASEDALELEYKHWVHHDAASTGLPLKLFECQPVVGKKVVTMEVAGI